VRRRGFVDSFWSRVRDVLWIAACFALSACIAWQGWRGITSGPDFIPDILNAASFLETGTLPSRGDVSTYSSVNPPGTAWLFLPGVLMFSDYRLFESCGSLMLHAGTLIGLFLLVHLAFNRSAARLAVLLYALSPIGLFFAGSLWPRGHPFFVLWFVLFTALWHTRANAKYLAAALVTWAAGMYVFMEVAPMILLLPVVWYLYRPPLGAKWLAVAGSASLLIWFPYLRFEQARGFSDVASLIFQVDVMPANRGDSFCDPTLRELGSAQPPVPAEETTARVRHLAGRLWRKLRDRPHAAATGLLGNFTLVRIDPGTGSVGPRLRAPLLLLLVLVVLALVAPPVAPLVAPPRLQGVQPSTVDLWRFRSACLLVAVSMMLFLALFSLHAPLQPEALDSGLGTEKTTALAAMAGLLVGIYQWRRSSPDPIRSLTVNDAGKISILALVLPWAALLLVSEDLQRRYLFLWPLQAALLAFLATGIAAHWKVRAFTMRVAQLALVLAIAANSTLIAKVDDWRAHGWAGLDSDVLRSLEFVGRRVHQEGKDRAAVGYLLHDYCGDYRVIDARYRTGMEMDYVLGQRFGVHNTNRCAEGVSASDDYIVTQLGLDPQPPAYVRLRRQARDFRQVARFGEYAVLQRNP
jgi:hypothetical protein